MLQTLEFLRTHRTSVKRKLLSITVFLISIVIPIIGTEIFLSLITPNQSKTFTTRSIRLREHKPNSISYLTPSNETLKKLDGGLQSRQFRLRIDENGYIFPSEVHKNPDKKIVFLGGSTTECFLVDEMNRFPYLVGRLLEKNGKRINTYNAGKSGNHSFHSINILLNKSLSLKPDIVVLMHNINDLNTLIYEKSYWNSNPYRSLIESQVHPPHYTYVNFNNIIHRLLPQIYSRLSLLRRKYFPSSEEMPDEFANIRGKQITFDDEKIIQQFSQNLELFIRLAKVYKFTPVIMTQANRFTQIPNEVIFNNWALTLNSISYESYYDIYHKMNQAIRDVGLSNNVLVIDLAAKVPPSSSYIYDSVHLNDDGSKYIASLIAKHLAPTMKENALPK